MISAKNYSLTLAALGLMAATAGAQQPDFLGSPRGNAGASDANASTTTLIQQDGIAADQSGWIGGVGFYLMQPFFQNNPAYTVLLEQTKDTVLDTRNPSTQTLSETARTTDVNQHMVMAPLVWIGYIDSDGLGVRLRGWEFQEGTGQSVSLPPFSGQYKASGAGGQTVIVTNGPLQTAVSAAPLGLQAFGDTLSIQHGPEATTLAVATKLFAQVADLEVLQRFSAGDVTFLVSGGLRYVRLDQTYNAYDAQSTSAVELRTLESSNNFEGLGPTVAVELRRPFGDSGLAAYGQVRGSFVYGASNQNAVFFGQELRNDDPNPQFANDHHDRGLSILDLETGLEYGRQVGKAWLFGQIALAGQDWINAGSSSGSAMMMPATKPRPVLGGAPVDSNIAFLGLTFRVGVNY